MIRVVLDTNTVVSALLFSGTASRLVPAWQGRRITTLLSRPMLEEYLRVLAYPKFALSAGEIRALIEEEVLPFAEIVRVRRRLRPPITDVDDHKFFDCAVAGRAAYLVTGDRELLDLESYRGVTIVNAAQFLARLER